MSHKNYIKIVIVGILILNVIEVGSLKSNREEIDFEIHKNDSLYTVIPKYSHTILGEFGTTTWCGWCKYAHGALKNLTLGDWHPFFYVTMVADKNMHAANRIWNDYNCYGYPTVFWDGGFKVIGGAGSVPGAMATYNMTIIRCGIRTVPDIDINLNVTWLGNATLDIDVSVDNNNGTIYDGYIRVYITEVSSTLGWYDTWNHPYTFAFLEYAFDENISIPINETWHDSIIWDGHDYYYGVGYDFGNISYGNIMVIAVVFNSEWHQGYAYPPDGNPFDAYWVDDAVGFRVGNNSLPNVPSNPSPGNGDKNVNTEADLSWTGGDPNQWNPEDRVTYDVYFGKNSSPPKVSSNQTNTFYDPGTLDIKTTYYWKIIAWDNHGAFTIGPIWNFTTSEIPNRSPDVPTINGSTTGKIGVEYNCTFISIDPNNDDIYYLVQWNDGCGSEDWVGPYLSGEEIILSHTYNRKGTYIIHAKAIDIYGAESNWSKFEIEIPRNRVYYLRYLGFLDRFPILERLLNLLR